MYNIRYRLVRLHRKVYVANLALKHFMCHEWKFENKKSVELLKLPLSPKERELFLYDYSTVDVKDIYR